MEIETKLTVRYAETDQMGIVHHSNYPIWFEAGRSNYLKALGVANTTIESKGVLLPLYDMNCQFKSPAKFGDEVIVKTSIKDISRVRLSFSYVVLNAMTEKIIATGETMHAWTDKDLKPINAEKSIPEIYRNLY